MRLLFNLIPGAITNLKYLRGFQYVMLISRKRVFLNLYI